MITRQTRLGIGVLFAAALFVTACSESAFNGVRVETPFTKSTATWWRADSSPYNIAQETAGKVTLLYFGYTHCPEICPMQLMNLAKAFEKLGADTASQFRTVFITLDPARDTGAVLEKWLRVIDPRFVALRASLAQVDGEIARLKLAPGTPNKQADVEADPAHASAIVAYSRDGLAHFVYPANVNPEAWAYDLRKLLRDSVP